MLFLIFVLFPTTFGLQCLFTDSDTFSSITYFQESSIINPGNVARNTTCTHADDKCFGGSFLKLLNSTTSEYIIVQMCLSDALTNIRYHRLDVNVDCNQIMPVKHTSDDLLYSYRCCDNFDCEPPILPTNNNPKPTVTGGHKGDGGAASTVFLSFSMLFVSLFSVLL